MRIEKKIYKIKEAVIAPMESMQTSVRLPLLPGTKLWWNSSRAAKITVQKNPVRMRFFHDIKLESQAESGSCKDNAKRKYSVMWAHLRTK